MLHAPLSTAWSAPLLAETCTALAALPQPDTRSSIHSLVLDPLDPSWLVRFSGRLPNGLWRFATQTSLARQWSPFLTIDLQTMSEDEVIARLLIRSAHWSLNGLTRAKGDDARPSVLAELAKIATYQGLPLQEFLSTLRINSQLFTTDEITAAAQEARENQEALRVKIDEWFKRMQYHEIEPTIVAFFEMALHTRIDVPTFLLVVKRLASYHLMTWKEIVALHARSQSAFQQDMLRFMEAQGGRVPFTRAISPSV